MEINFKSEDENRTYSVTEEVFDKILFFSKKQIKEYRKSSEDMDY